MGSAVYSPVYVDGKIYACNIQGELYCVDADDGQIIWSVELGDWVYGSSPSISDGRVFIGTLNDDLICLDALTGNIIWSFEADYYVSSSPIISQNQVYFSTGDGMLYCLDFQSGNLEWTYDSDDKTVNDPSVSNDKVIFGCENGKIFCLDLTGDLVWSYTSTSSIGCTPSILANNVVFHSSNTVICLDLDTGVEKWVYASPDPFLYSIAQEGDDIYIASKSKIYCLNSKDGTLVSEFIPKAEINSSPSLSNDILFVCTDSLVNFDRKTGKTVTLGEYSGTPQNSLISYSQAIYGDLGGYWGIVERISVSTHELIDPSIILSDDQLFVSANHQIYGFIYSARVLDVSSYGIPLYLLVSLGVGVLLLSYKFLKSRSGKQVSSQIKSYEGSSVSGNEVIDSSISVQEPRARSFCSSCGSENRIGANFCLKCGNKLT